MIHETPEQRAIALLEIHNGYCFVPEGNELVEPFREMEQARLVTIAENHGQVAGIYVRSINFTPTLEPLDDDEEQAH